MAGEPAVAQMAAAAPAAPDLDDTLDQARMEAAHILQEAAAEAESAQATARAEGYEAGRQEGLAAGRADLDLMRRQAELEVEKARVEAEGMRRTAEAEAKAVRAEAEARGLAALAEAREQARQSLEEAREERHRSLEAAHAALVELAVAAAVRLVQGHLALQPASVVGMVAAGLRRLKETNCSVRVSPQDLPLLQAQRSTLERELGSGLLQLQPDTGLAQGDYLVSSTQGQIDARLEHQATHLKEALEAALGGSTT